MTSTKKGILAILFSAVLMLSLISGLAFNPANASTACLAVAQNSTNLYYRDHLLTKDKGGVESDYELAQDFYSCLEAINAAGDFKKGRISYDLSSVLTSAQIEDWVINGNAEIPKAFGAARDAFLMDHPELFYVDMYKLTISAARQSGVYSATVDSGRAANVYRDNTYTSEQEVEQAIEKFNAAVKKVADDAVETVNADNSETERDLALAIAVNETIATDTQYDFKTYDSAMENPTDAKADALTFTSYGALVDKMAVCSGYSMAYKAVMDKLGIPCVVVSGHSRGKNQNGTDTETTVGHSWNYVYLKTVAKEVSTSTEVQTVAETAEISGQWFAFDTTWNSLSSNKNKYSNMNAMAASEEHIADGVISSSNYSLRYPALSATSYEQAVNPNAMDFTIKDGDFTVKTVHGEDEDSMLFWSHLSYKGKNATKLLAEDNQRLIYRQFIMQDGEKVWTKWVDMSVMLTIENMFTGYVNVDDATTAVFCNTSFQYAQYAVVEGLEPDEATVITDKVYYTDPEAVSEHAVFMSQPIENLTYGTYTPGPYLNVEQTTPYCCGDITISDSMSEGGDSVIVADSKAILVSAVYDEPLYALDSSKDIEVYVTPDHESSRQYTGFAKFSDGKYVHLVADKKGVYNTLQFRFKPSLMYEHNRESYTITFGNVGSAKIIEKRTDEGGLERTTSDKEPMYMYLRFSRVIYACPKVFGDGRLWVECCAQPTLVDNSDLSAMNFEDESGQSTFNESARSQMMLVVNNVSKETENTMLDEITDNGAINVGKDEIVDSQTYDINLQMCGKIAKIPDKSYVKIALGFPEGYGPDDEGVSFKIFHRKHDVESDEYIIEEIPCVVTKFGIVVTVTSFSPYMVAVVPKDKVTTKTVYASIDGKGGTLTKDDGRIQTIPENGSYSYTITPDAGYKVYSVTLNGKEVKSRIDANDKLTLNYDELDANNELEIKYISDESHDYFVEKNIVEPVKIYMAAETDEEEPTPDPEPTPTPAPTPTPEGEPTTLGVWAIVGICVGGVAVIADIVLIVLIVLKKKKSAARKAELKELDGENAENETSDGEETKKSKKDKKSKKSKKSKKGEPDEDALENAAADVDAGRYGDTN